MPEPATNPSGLPWRQLGGAGVVLAVLGLAGGLAWWLSPQPKPAAHAEAPAFSPPPLSPSPYRNTTAEAHYLGSKACVKCHQEESEAYYRTGMGQSMALARADQAPPDGEVDHRPSGRRYRVYRKDGRLYHRESLGTSDREEVVLSDFPVQYAVGSGLHTTSYLAEVGAERFVVQSPVTWYTAHRRWDMSPGYDNPVQPGFERPVAEGCVLCHAGRVEALDGSVHRFRFHELTIGCERCHGPGSLHVARQNHPETAAKSAGSLVDDTIVNPKRLPRPLAEAVCEQCHLESPCEVPVRGRSLADFRPGLPLQDFRLYYQVRQPDGGMTIIGHVEQMHASACYQKSSDLTCLTCHNPHGFPRAEERVGYYRAICQNCHEHKKPCTDPAAQDAKNACVKCHMPTGPTDVPHVAFTHHRIGLHPDRKHSAPPARVPELLEPVHDLSRFGEMDRKASLARAYLQLGNKQQDEPTRQAAYEWAARLLKEVQAAGFHTSTVDSTACRMSVGREPAVVVAAARQALAHADLPAVDRCQALYALADALYRERKYPDAVTVLNELNRLGRDLPNWLLLADCYQALGNRDEAVQALEEAAAIRPTFAPVRRVLANYYEQKGDRERAEYHRRRIVEN